MNSMLRAAAEGRPLVYGHRGARSYAPMNTISSFEVAVDQGADGIELDVQLSSDGRLMVMHDFTVDGSTDGKGAVKDLSFAQLREFNAAARFTASEVPLDGKALGPFPSAVIPTLDEVFTLVRDRCGKDFVVNVEIKSQVCAPDGSEGPTAADGVEKAVAALIARYEMADRVIISCFNPGTLFRCRALMPNTPLGYLYGIGAPTNTVPLMAKAEYEAWHPEWKAVSPELIAKEKAAGRLVNIWTVNSPARAALLVADGAAGIITDVPDRILNALARR